MTPQQRTAANKAIAKFMGFCGDDWYIVTESCPQCGGTDPWSGIHGERPDYCSDDSPRSVLNEVEAKITMNYTKPSSLIAALSRATTRDRFAEFATAEQRAWAILDVLGQRAEIEALGE